MARNPSRTGFKCVKLAIGCACLISYFCVASLPPKVTVLGPANLDSDYYGPFPSDVNRTAGVYLAKASANRVAWGHKEDSPDDDLYIKVWTRSNQTTESVWADANLNSGLKLQLGGISGDGNVIVGTLVTPDPPNLDFMQPFTWQFGDDEDELNTTFNALGNTVPIRGSSANIDGSFIGIQTRCDPCSGENEFAHLYAIGSGIALLFPSGRTSMPFSVNSDASVVVGYRGFESDSDPPSDRTSCRTGVGGNSPFIWDATNGFGYVSIAGGVAEGGCSGQSWVNGKIVGSVHSNDTINSATVLGHGFRVNGNKDGCDDYVGEGLLPPHLDTLNGVVFSHALDQGTRFAVGDTSQGFFPNCPGTGGGAVHAVWWDENSVPYDLNEVFAYYIPNSLTYEFEMVTATSIANDDRSIAGVGRERTKESNAWGPWTQVSWFAELESCPGDLDYDDFVGDADFVIFAYWYDVSVCSHPGGCRLLGDLDWNREVNDADFILFTAAYTQGLCE